MTNLTRDEILALDRRYVWRPYTSHEDHAARDPVVVVRAQGVWLEDANGHRYIDASGSWWSSNLGHNHPRIVAAVRDQAETLLHCALADATHSEAARLAEAIIHTAPPGLARVFYSDDGSTAVETAIKMACQYWQQNGAPKRTRFVSLGGAFHGDTLGAVSVGGEPVFRRAFGPLLFDVVHMPAGNDDASWERAVTNLADLLRRDRDTIAGVVVEPMIQGAAGMRFWPASALAELRAITKEIDTFLIADEVFVGYGRTGPMWGVNHAGITPDFLATAKGFSGGALPFAATLATERVYEGFRGGRARALLHGHTFTGNPLGARVAREVLAIYRDESVLAGIPARTALIRACMDSLATRRGITNARALGMVGAVDLGGQGYLSDAGVAITDAARARGIHLRPLGDTIYVSPAINIPISDLTTLLSGLSDSINEVVAKV